jgi:hypothetical protein
MPSRTSGPIEYFRGDERPPWRPVVRVDDVLDDMSTGYTFTVLVRDGLRDPVLTKTTGITGGAAGVVTVSWGTDELNIPPGAYRALLTATRTIDSAQWTLEERLIIKSK